MQRYNILCSPDNNYTQYCGIMLTSLFENNKEQLFNIIVLCNNLSKENKESLYALAKKYNQQLVIQNIDDNLIKEWPIREGDHISIAAYYRLLTPIILPDDIDKILYLDCDIIVNGNIKELYNCNIRNVALGAVLDEDYKNEVKYSRLEYSKEKPYINSGVLLINLEYWRKNNVTNRLLSYINDNPDKVLFHDQDTINAVLHNEITLLPIKYNFQTGFLYKRLIADENILSEIEECKYTPCIIHFTGPNKPWIKDSQHPYCNRFKHFKTLSLWSATPLVVKKTNVLEKLINIRNNIIWYLGIKKRLQTYIIAKQE